MTHSLVVLLSAALGESDSKTRPMNVLTQLKSVNHPYLFDGWSPSRLNPVST